MAYLWEMKGAEIKTAEDTAAFYTARDKYFRRLTQVRSNGLVDPELEESSRIGHIIRMRRKRLNISTEEVAQQLAAEGDEVLKIKPIDQTIYEHGYRPFPQRVKEKVVGILQLGKEVILPVGQKEATPIPA